MEEEGKEDSNDNNLIDNMKAQKATFSSSVSAKNFRILFFNRLLCLCDSNITSLFLLGSRRKKIDIYIYVHMYQKSSQSAGKSAQ